MISLDHIAVLGETLEEAATHLEDRLGALLLPGGQHARYGTHNRLLGLAPSLYIEAIAIDAGAPPPPDARWFGLDNFHGPARLDKWVCRVDDMDAVLEKLPIAGKRVELSRGDLRWAMAVPEDGQLPFDGMFPALIQWHGDLLPGNLLPAGGLELNSLTVCHPEVDQLKALLDPLLNSDLVRFEIGPPGLAAAITTPQGPRVLQ